MKTRVAYSSDINAHAIHDTCEKRGWKKVSSDENQWNVLWGLSGKCKSFFRRDTEIILNDNQIINHFPNSYVLTRKDYLPRSLKSYVRTLEKKGVLPPDLIPQTFVLPQEYSCFLDEYDKSPTSTWILKPCSGSQGHGIFLTSKLADVRKWTKSLKPIVSNIADNTSYVISKYIDNPLLIQGKKFDLRLYVLVTSYKPLKAYLFKQGFCRFSVKNYTPDDSTLGNNFIHITNNSIQRHSRLYNKHHAEKWGIENLRLYLESTIGLKLTDHLFKEINTLIVHSLKSVQDFIASDRHCFECYGYDVIIDNNLQPWLIEVNASPSIVATTDKDRILKRTLIDNIFSIVLPPSGYPDVWWDKKPKDKHLGNFVRLIDEDRCRRARYIDKFNNQPFNEKAFYITKIPKKSCTNRKAKGVLHRRSTISKRSSMTLKIFNANRVLSVSTVDKTSLSSVNTFRSSNNLSVNTYSSISTTSSFTTIEIFKRLNNSFSENSLSNANLLDRVQAHKIKSYCSIEKRSQSFHGTINTNTKEYSSINGRLKRCNTRRFTTKMDTNSSNDECVQSYQKVYRTNMDTYCFIKNLYNNVNISENNMSNCTANNNLMDNEMYKSNINTNSSSINQVENNKKYTLDKNSLGNDNVLEIKLNLRKETHSSIRKDPQNNHEMCKLNEELKFKKTLNNDNLSQNNTGQKLNNHSSILQNSKSNTLYESKKDQKTRASINKRLQSNLKTFKVSPQTNKDQKMNSHSSINKGSKSILKTPRTNKGLRNVKPLGSNSSEHPNLLKGKKGLKTSPLSKNPQNTQCKLNKDSNVNKYSSIKDSLKNARLSKGDKELRNNNHSTLIKRSQCKLATSKTCRNSFSNDNSFKNKKGPHSNTRHSISSLNKFEISKMSGPCISKKSSNNTKTLKTNETFNRSLSKNSLIKVRRNQKGSSLGKCVLNNTKTTKTRYESRSEEQMKIFEKYRNNFAISREDTKIPFSNRINGYLESPKRSNSSADEYANRERFSKISGFKKKIIEKPVTMFDIDEHLGRCTVNSCWPFTINQEQQIINMLMRR